MIFLNTKLYYKPLVENNMNKDIENQLHFLKKVLKNGADSDMQSIYPEGYIFINALYGLTWFDLANGDKYKLRNGLICSFMFLRTCMNSSFPFSLSSATQLPSSRSSTLRVCAPVSGTS